MSKLENVEVIRYIRPTNTDHSNLGGMTVIFKLDYTARTVGISYSVCSLSDNFEKAKGLAVARSSNEVETFNLDDFASMANSTGSFTKYYLTHLRAKCSKTKRETIAMKFLASVNTEFDYYL